MKNYTAKSDGIYDGPNLVFGTKNAPILIEGNGKQAFSFMNGNEKLYVVPDDKGSFHIRKSLATVATMLGYKTTSAAKGFIHLYE